jgi:uncharacterized UBP type Zn finger protein
MKKLIFLLAIAFSLCSCYTNRWTHSATQPTTKTEEVGKSKLSISSDGKTLHNVSGIIIAKAKSKSGDYVFYVNLEINKQIRWVTTETIFNKKDVGDIVFYDYLGTYRLQ